MLPVVHALCGVTVALAEADLVLSATLVAVIVYVSAVFGAVYSPALVIVPPVADQVTAVFDVPLTVAVNCCVAPVASVATVGLMLTVTGGGGAVTVTVAEADLVVSASLVTLTVNVPAVLGAVYRPAVVIVPPVVDHVTAVSDVPVTLAVNCCVAAV